MAEQRQALRHPLRQTVLAVNRRPTDHAYLLDFSPFGVKLEYTQPLKPSEAVELAVIFPRADKTVALDGRVAWLDAGKAARGYYHMGICFNQPYHTLESIARP